MRFQRRYFNFMLSLGLSVGFLLTQICNVICLAGNCAVEKKTVTPTTSHCHDAESPSQPAPTPDTHNCQNHDLTILLSASGSLLDTFGQVDWHPLAFVPENLELAFTQQRIERVRFASLRSPPRTPQRLILRI